jgi:hypothetical protein
MDKYTANETMRVLGESLLQYRFGFDRTDVIYKAFMQNLKPFERVPIREMMADAYALGVMDGKRMERQRRKDGHNAGKEV